MRLSYQNVFELVVNSGGLCVESWERNLYDIFVKFQSFCQFVGGLNLLVVLLVLCYISVLMQHIILLTFLLNI